MRRFFLLLLFATPFWLAGCAQVPSSGGTMFSVVNQRQELAIGDAAAQHDLKLYGLYQPGAPVAKHVEKLCERVFAVTEAAQDPLQCLLLDSEIFNAQATPGYLMVFRGLLPYVNSEAELAAVMAHEAGHINARHVAKQVTRDTVLQLLQAGGLIAAQGTGASEEATLLAHDYGGKAATLAGRAYSRSDEREADALAQRYMEKLGYDRREAVAMLRALQSFGAYDHQLSTAIHGGEEPTDSLWETMTATHPDAAERIQLALETAGGKPDGSVKLPAGVTPATPAADPQGRNRLFDLLEGLPVGPHRPFGIAGRGYLAIPSVSLVLALPDGYATHYVGATKPKDIGTWLGGAPESRTTFRLGVYKLRAGTNIGSFMIRESPYRPGELQRFQIGGEDGVTAYTAALKETFGSLRFRMVGIPAPERNAGVVVVFTFPDAATQAREEPELMRRLAQSRILPRGDMNKWQPLRLHTFTAAHGDTVSRRAASLPAGGLREEWFRALNGLTPVEELVPGRRYKTVVDPNLTLL